MNNQYLANYQTDFNGQDIHHFEALAGYEQFRYKYQYFYGKNDHLYDPTIGELSNANGNGDSKLVKSYTDNYMTEGFLSRAQYDYKERYFISGSYRRDASSRFAPGHRWGNFYSIGGAWQISKEDWFNVPAIDYLKLKASYGEQGNDNLLSYYPYADMYETTYNAESGEYSLILTQKGNDELTWEKSKNFNIGFDFGLWRGRFTGSLEFYNRATSDLLYNKSTPISSGVTTGSFPINVGSVVNRGVEFNFDAQIIKTRNVTLGASFNITANHNEITSLDGDVPEDGIKGGYWIRKVGGSVYEAYLNKAAGICQQADIDASDGKFKAADLGRQMYWKDVTDKDGNIIGQEKTCNFSEATKYDCGTTLPKVFGGFGLNATFYNFDLSAQFQYQLGGKFYDSQYQALMWTQDSRGQNMHKDLLKAWTPENTNTTIPRLDTEYAVAQSSVDTYLTSSNYLSLNNLTLGYTMPKTMSGKLGIGGLRVYVAGENLFMLTARKGMDPRYSFGLGSYTYGNGLASNSYATLRTITAGVTLTFGGTAQKAAKAEPVYTAPEYSPVVTEKIVEKIVEKPVVKEVVKETVKNVQTTYVVTFPVNSYQILDLEELNGIAQGANVEIVAYSSPEGSTQANMELSEKRATAVADYLKSRGVNVISATAKGAATSHSNRIAIVTVK